MAKSRIAEAYVQIVPRIDGVGSAVRSQLQGELAAAGEQAGGGMAQGVGKGMGGKLKGYLAPIAAAAAASFAAVGIANFFKDAVTGASNLAEQSSAVKVVFGDGAKAVEDFARKADSALGLSTAQALEGAKSFGIFGKAAGLNEANTASFSTSLLTLSADLASFNNTSVDDAMLALQAGLRGESEPLRRFGVLLDDATLKAKAMEMGIYSGTGALTPQQKVLASQASILEQTNLQQGDFARTSEGLANQQRILAAQVENTKAKFGTALLPVMTTLAAFANDTLVPALNGIADGFQWMFEHGEIMIPILAGLGAAILYNLAPAIWGAVTSTWAWTVALLANPATWITLAIIALVAAIVALAMNWDAVTKWVGEVWDGFTKWLTDSLNGIATWWSELWAGIFKAVEDIWNNIVAFFQGAIDFLVQLFLNWTIYGLIIKNWDNIMKFFGSIWDAIVGFFKGAADNISKVWNGVIDWFKSLPQKIMDFFAGAGKWLLDAGKNIIDGLLNGLKNAGKVIGEFFLNLLPSWIVGPFKAALGIKSPSKVFKEFGKNIIQGLNKGLVGDEASVKSSIQKVSKFITDAFADKKISKKTKNAANKLIKTLTAELGAVAKQHDAVIEKLKAAQDSLADKLKEKADYIGQIAEKYGSVLTLNEDTSAADAIKQLEERIAKNKELLMVLDDLKAAGLSDSLYGQIVSSGNLDFAKSIQAGGAETVAQLNLLSAEADKSAAALGERAGAVLFDQGINVAKGIVDGLVSEEAALSAAMENLANTFVTALGKLLSKDHTGDVTATSSSTNKTTGTATTTFDPNAAFSNIPKLAKGGFVSRPTMALVGEAGPEVVMPLKDFERMSGAGQSGNVMNYYAAPNQSVDSEQQLFTALKRAKAFGW